MFAEVKALLPVSGDGYDAEIVTQINAAVLDLTTSAEIVLPGTVSVSRNTETGKITDNSTLTDEKAITTIAVWCNMFIGNPPNISFLKEAYKELKGSMRLSKRYKENTEATTE